MTMQIEYLGSGDPPRWSIKANCQDALDAFKVMGELNDLFSRDKCGKCGSQAMPTYNKTTEGYEYYGMRCSNPECRYEFKFGQRRSDGMLFPKLLDKDGNSIPNGGWVPPYKSDNSNSQDSAYSERTKPERRPDAVATGEQIPF